jgi:hypothetical protein
VDFGSIGLWRYDGSFTRLGKVNAEGVYGIGGEAYVDLGSAGLHQAVRGLLWNDSDVEGSPLSAAVVSNASHGSVVVQPDGSFTYTPEAGFVGTDSFTYKVNDGMLDSAPATVNITVLPLSGANLMASRAPEGAMEATSSLAEAELEAITAEAIERWTETLSLDSTAQALLSRVSIEIVDFSDLTLGRAVEDTVLIDVDAAGYGWYVDTTPADDVEFGLTPGELELMAAGTSPALGRMDLLTVVMHELGHVLGYDDLDPSVGALMSGSLDAGVRRLVDGGSNQVSPVTETDGHRSLVSMERIPNRHDSDKPVEKKEAKVQNSWLMEFLIEGGVRQYNPFEPTEKIQVKIGDHTGGKKYH